MASAGYNYWAPKVDSYFQSRGLPTGLGPSVLGVENANVGMQPAVVGKFADGLLQQSTGFMKQWNPGGSIANPDDQMAAAANFYSAQLSKGYSPADAYVIYQQGSGGGVALLNADPNSPASNYISTAALTNNGMSANATAGEALAHIRGQYNTGTNIANRAGVGGLASGSSGPGAGDTTVPAELAKEGYTYGGKDENGDPYYVSKDGTVSAQYDAQDKKWYNYDSTTGDPIVVDSSGQRITPDQPGYQAAVDAANADGTGQQTSDYPTPSYTTPGSGSPGGSTSGAGGAGGAGGLGGAAATAAGGMNIGGAGCAGGGMSPAQMMAGAGILGNLGGLAQGALMSGAMAALGGAGLQGIMGAALGSAAGALGNSLGASLGGAMGGIVGQTLGGALGAIVSGQNPLQALSGAAFGALSSMGAGLIPGLSNVMPAGLAQAAMGGLSGVLGQIASGKSPSVSMALAGGLSGMINSVTNNMTGNPTLGATLGAVAAGAITGQLQGLNSAASGKIDLGKYANLIGTAAAVVSSNKTMVGAIAEATSQGFGNTVGGYGSTTRNMQDAMTFGISTLGQNISAVSTDLIALGNWDATNLMRLMQPGNVAIQILNAGIGDLIGLTDAFYSYDIPIAGLDNPVYDRITIAVLSKINDPNGIALVQTTINMTTKINNLADLCNFQLMMPTSYTNMPANNFREFGIHLATIGINTADTLKNIGIAFSKIETSSDLNHVSQLSQPMPPEIANSLMQLYGYGGGSLGEQTMADIIGTPAGYVHTDTIPVITASSEIIMNHSATAKLKILTNLLTDTLAGKYTKIGDDGDPNANPPVPSDNGSIVVPFPDGSQTFSTLDDAILAFIPLIEAEHQALLNNTDPALQDAINKLNLAWNASCAQIIKENNNLIAHDIDIFDPTPTTPDGAMMFAQNLEQWGLETGYGQAGHYLERIASNDLYGDCIKYSMRQARNAAALEGLGIDTEKFKLPRSHYYREPENFYQTLYTGTMPAKPQNVRAVIYPRTPTDVYITDRTKALQDLGYSDSVPLLNNQKDEIYYDSLWTNTDPAVLENIGQSVVKNVINSNILVKFPNIVLKDLTGNERTIAQIKPTGLLLTNNDYFVTTLLNLVNRALYGDLITTKYDNPFNTDQMIYGMLELLSQVNYQNIAALLQTTTGGIIGSGLLTILQQIFQKGAVGGLPGFNAEDFVPGQGSRSLFNTTMDRNDPAAWGATGPDSVPNPNIKN